LGINISDVGTEDKECLKGGKVDLLKIFRALGGFEISLTAHLEDSKSSKNLQETNPVYSGIRYANLLVACSEPRA